jgi:MYXO-CTERM domain-containing protein/uncharacterized repeat protein (TIGR01451 family)
MMHGRLGLVGLMVVALSCSDAELPAAGVAVTRQSLVTNFAAGSLIIPMDTSFQDSGMLRAYGLVYALLKQGVPVHWAIREGKASQASDFTASARNLVTMAALTNTTYRGGPFIIDQAQRAQALPIINAWQIANPSVVVHDATAAFSADIKMVLRAAPRVGVFVDGNEDIAFRVLNAAGIMDSANVAWPTVQAASYPGRVDVLSTTQLRGASAGSGTDGALLRSDGTPQFHFLISMHYDTPDTEVVREVRQWLTASPLAHAFMQCTAVTAFENDTNGRFLTTQGVRQETDTSCVLVICSTDNRSPPNPPVNRAPSSEFNQWDGTLTVDTGALQSMGLAAGSTLRPGVEVMLAGAATGNERMAYVRGSLDGNAARGQVSYLVGHDYSTTLPISSNPRTNGSRLLLDSLFASSLTTAAGQPNVSLTKSGPALTNANAITWTLSYTNTGTGVAEAAVIRDTIPTGTTFASATGGGTLAGNVVSWQLGTLAPGETGSVTVTVAVSADASYANTATLAWRVGLTPAEVTSNTVTTQRDTVAPQTSLLTTPATATNATTASFTFSSSEPGTFECSLDGATFATCTSPQAFMNLAEGTHQFRVRAVDAAGNVDATPATFTWVVDRTAPSAPTISQPSAGGTAGAQPTVSGLAEPGSTVEVRVDGTLVGTVQANATSGAWSYTLTMSQSLSNGAHSAQAIATDAAGNPSQPATRAFNVDTSQPAAPAITAPANGSAINTTTPLVTGTAPANATVRVFSDGVLIATVTADGTGAWQYQLTGGQALSVGAHELSARTVSPSMVESAAAITLVTVDTSAPVAPTITAPTTGQRVNTATPTVTGTSEPFATISVVLDSGTPVTTVADATGAWSVQLSGVMEGSHQVAASARDRAGNAGPSSGAVPFEVDTTAPATPVLVSPTAGQETNNPRLPVTGTAEPGSQVEVLVDGVIIGSATVDGAGNWTFTPTADVAEGTHELTVRATDAAGNRSPASMPRTFVIDRTAPAAPVISSPAMNSQTRLAQPSITGTAEPGATVTVTLDGMTAGTATADSLGNWTFVPTTPLAEGAHTVSARATDRAGNQGTPSGDTSFGVDTMAPVAPVISLPTAGSTVTNTPTISGTAEAGSRVEVRIDGMVVATVLADMNGAWSYTSPSPIADGAHTATAVATDRAGNQSPESASIAFTTASPAADGGVDAGVDGGTDAGVLDGGSDAGIVDAGVVDAGVMDDAGIPDAGTGGADAGTGPVYDYAGGGCGCSTPGAEAPWMVALALGLLAQRRRRE